MASRLFIKFDNIRWSMASITTFSGHVAVVVSPLASEYPAWSVCAICSQKSRKSSQRNKRIRCFWHSKVTVEHWTSERDSVTSERRGKVMLMRRMLLSNFKSREDGIILCSMCRDEKVNFRDFDAEIRFVVAWSVMFHLGRQHHYSKFADIYTLRFTDTTYM